MLIKSFLFEFIILIVLMLIAPLSVLMDLSVLKNNISEVSITEFMQEFLILFAAIIFFKAYLKTKEHKGLYILAAGLFLMMFIREADYYLDQIVHGFWKFPVILVLLTSIYYARKSNTNILNSILVESKTKEFTIVLIGFLIIVLFSRLFGTSSLWELVVSSEYIHITKTVVQEGLELFGYSILFYGAVLFHKRIKEA